MTPGQAEELDDIRRRELRRFVEIYAIRARELSEAVAALGWQIVAESRFDNTILDIKRLRILCDKAGADLLHFIEQKNPKTTEPPAAAATSDPPAEQN